MPTGITREPGMGLGKWHKGPYLTATCAICEAINNPSKYIRVYLGDGETIEERTAEHMRMAHGEKEVRDRLAVSPNLADRLASALKPPVV